MYDPEVTIREGGWGTAPNQLMADYPEQLQELVDFFAFLPGRAERIDTLISLSDRFSPPPERIATRPYPDSHKVEACESGAYVWAEPRAGGTLQFYFAIENPQGITAMALAVILAETLSGAPLQEVGEVSPEIVYAFFGRELSIRKTTGLMSMVRMVTGFARRHTKESTSNELEAPSGR